MKWPRAWNVEAVRLVKTGFPWLRAMIAACVTVLTHRDREKNLLNTLSSMFLDTTTTTLV